MSVLTVVNLGMLVRNKTFAVVTTPSSTCTLRAGQLFMLEGREAHAVKAVTDSSLLVTVLLNTP